MPREVPLAGVGQFRGFRNGRKMQDSLPLWQGRRTGQVGQAEAGLRSLPDDAAVEHTDDAVGLLGLGLVVGHHQDGLAALLVDLVQELHDLRCGKGRRTGVAREVPPAGVGQFRGFHNGRKMQDSLPLWQGAEDRAGRAGRGRPQVPTR